jgi:hypothetical protein
MWEPKPALESGAKTRGALYVPPRQRAGGYAPVEVAEPGTKRAALWEACQRNDAQAVVEMLGTAEGRSLLEVGDRRRFTPLDIAASFGNPEMVDALLKAGANPRARARNGETPLHAAARCTRAGGQAVRQLLLDAGADPLIRSTLGERPCDIAARSANQLEGEGRDADVAELRQISARLQDPRGAVAAPRGSAGSLPQGMREVLQANGIEGDAVLKLTIVDLNRLGVTGDLHARFRGWQRQQPPPLPPQAQLVQAANAGDLEAEYELGRRLANGCAGVAQKLDQGILHLSRAAEGGHAKAQLLLGCLKANRDPSMALDLFTAASSQGGDSANDFCLGRHLFLHWQADRGEEGAGLVQRAARGGHKGASLWLRKNGFSQGPTG